MPSTFDDSPPVVDTFYTPVAGQPLNSGVGQAALYKQHTDALVAIENKILAQGIYIPTPSGNGLTTFTSSWVGAYTDYGKFGVISLACEVKATWSGTGFISASLPSGWVGSGVESFLPGHCYPMPNPFGLHFNVQGVVHAGFTDCRFTTSAAFSARLAGQGPGYCSAVAASDQFNAGVTASPSTHGLVLGDQVWVEFASTTLPTGLTTGVYYVTNKNTDGTAWTPTSTVFKLSATAGGNAVNITADGVCAVRKAVDISGRGGAELAIDGVAAPFNFTGDGTAPNDDMMFVSGVVFKNLS